MGAPTQIDIGLDAPVRIRGVEHGQCRKCGETYRLMAMKGTPYHVFYRVNAEQDLITIEAVWRSMRGEGPDLG